MHIIPQVVRSCYKAFSHVFYAAVVAFCAVGALTAQAANSWVYDSTAKTLTEQVDSGTPWVFTGVTSSSGNLTIPHLTKTAATTPKYTQGDSTELDFTTIANAAGTSTYRLTTIGTYALYNNDYITKVVAPNVTVLNNSVFYSCGNLVELNCGRLTKIDTAAIESCTKLTLECYRDPDTGILDLSSVTTFNKNRYLYAVTGTVSLAGRNFSTSDQGTFSGWTNVTELIIKSNYKHSFSTTSPLGSWKSLKTMGPLDDDVIQGSSSAGLFYPCTALEYLTLGSDTSSVAMSIPTYFLSGKTAFKRVTMLNNVTAIGTYAFNNCPALNYIRWPGTKPTIGTRAFGSTSKTFAGGSAVLRQYFPYTNTTWKAEITGDANYEAWNDLTDDVKSEYTKHYPGDPLPDGYCSYNGDNTKPLRKGFVFFYGKPEIAETVELEVDYDSTRVDYSASVGGVSVAGSTVASNAVVTVVATPLTGYEYATVPTGWSAGAVAGTITCDFTAENDPTVIEIPDPTLPARSVPSVDIGDNTQADITVDGEFREKIDPDGTKSDVQIKEELEKTGENGIKKIDSYILGLDPDEEDSVPIVTSTQNQDATKLTISMGNINIKTGAGAGALFRPLVSDTPDGEMKLVDGQGESSSATFEVPVPTGEKPVKYYKIGWRLQPTNE